MRGKAAVLGSLLGLACAADAHALDGPTIAKIPLKLDITEASFLVQRFDARTLQGEAVGDGSFGYWINRLNVALTWGHFTLGARLDSSLWWNQPHSWMNDNYMHEFGSLPGPGNPLYVQQQQQAIADSYRFPQTIYPAKLWAVYTAPGIEVTAGDAYVQFARGMTVSMRKLDDLGIDNTVRGGKIAISKGPFAVTAFGGFANPSRVDESTGQTLFLQSTPDVDPMNVEPHTPHPVYGSDRMFGGEIQAGRGLPVVLATSGVVYSRCAPYAYDSPTKQNIVDAGLGSEIAGTCDYLSKKVWISGLTDQAATRQATEIDMISQSVEFPKLGPLGNLYLLGAAQKRNYEFDPSRNGAEAEGNALYASYSGTYGPVSNTFEFKSYRNFRPVVAAVDANRASAFAFVSYSNPPTTEVLTQDNLGTNDFNACATGGRLRTDIRMSKHTLAYFQGIYEVTNSEQSGASCDKFGNTVGQFAAHPEQGTNYVWDGTAGIQVDWDSARSYVYALINTREDTRGDGTNYLRQDDFEYTFSGYLGKAVGKLFHHPVSLELTGRNRLRSAADENFTANGLPVRWFEGENYAALKIAPKWVFTAGFEYTTKVALPTWYPNGSIIYKFTSDSNIRVFVGDQRGGLKCISGVCRLFPAFEGARLELVLRF